MQDTNDPSELTFPPLFELDDLVNSWFADSPTKPSIVQDTPAPVDSPTTPSKAFQRIDTSTIITSPQRKQTRRTSSLWRLSPYIQYGKLSRYLASKLPVDTDLPAGKYRLLKKFTLVYNELESLMFELEIHHASPNDMPDWMRTFLWQADLFKEELADGFKALEQ
jgi:hypothetical protein